MPPEPALQISSRPVTAAAPAPTPARPGDAEALAALDAAFSPAALAAALGVDPADVPPRLWEAALVAPAREFLSRPGKRFRARLAELAFALAGGDGPAPAAPGLIVELLHAGSLIVDDIEDGAFDRRGRPALHRMIGVPLALNTGNWLYFWAQSLLASPAFAGAGAQAQAQATRDLQTAMLRCHHGQALDLASCVDALTRAELPGVVAATTRLKTGALLELAARLGARAAGAGDELAATLGGFGRELGVALQMLDDLGGIATAARSEKGWEDLRQRRPTWPWAWVSERAGEGEWRDLVDELCRVAQQPLLEARMAAWALAGELARRTVVVGRARAREQLATALQPLSTRFRGHAALRQLEQEVARLEESYG